MRCNKALHKTTNALPTDQPLLSNSFVEPRPLAQIVADIARGISTRELLRPASTGTCAAMPSDGIAFPMAGSASHALRRTASSSALAGSASRALIRSEAPFRRPTQRSLSPKKEVRDCSAPHSQRKPKTSKGACKGDISSTAMDELIAVFGTFASGRQWMYWKDFERMLRSKLILDAQFMVLDARRIFDHALRDGQRALGPGSFQGLVREVAYERQCAVDSVCEMLLAR